MIIFCLVLQMACLWLYRTVSQQTLFLQVQHSTKTQYRQQLFVCIKLIQYDLLLVIQLLYRSMHSLNRQLIRFRAVPSCFHFDRYVHIWKKNIHPFLFWWVSSPLQSLEGILFKFMFMYKVENHFNTDDNALSSILCHECQAH